MKKTLLALALIATVITNAAPVAQAHGDKDSTDQTQQQDQQNTSTATLITEADVKFTHDAAAQTVTLAFADGTPMANAAVTVKNGETGETGDIEQNQAADADGVFDYSKWADKGAKVLRVTVPTNETLTGTIEYNFTDDTMLIEAGKSNKGSGDGSGGGDHSHSSTNMYLIAGGVVAVIAVGAIIAVSAKKKKQAAFAAKNKGKGKKDTK